MIIFHKSPFLSFHTLLLPSLRQFIVISIIQSVCARSQVLYLALLYKHGIKVPVFTWQELKCMLAIMDKIAYESNTVLLSNLIAGKSLLYAQSSKVSTTGDFK